MYKTAIDTTVLVNPAFGHKFLNLLPSSVIHLRKNNFAFTVSERDI